MSSLLTSESILDLGGLELVELHLQGGASHLCGASRLAFDGERYGAIGGETTLETANAGSEQACYEIEITGGASRLTIAEANTDGGRR